MSIKIRYFQKKDIERVYELGISVPEFSANDEKDHRFWPKNTLEEFANQSFSFVVEDTSYQEIVGFLLSSYQPITKKLSWDNMYLLPEYRKRGLAKKCFELSWTEAKKSGAVLAEGLVRKDNLQSKKMLENMGFVSAGEFTWMLKFS